MSRCSVRFLGGFSLATTLCLLVPHSACAQPEWAGAAIDPWGARGSSERVIASSSFIYRDTIDPWHTMRASRSWIAVGSGLDSSTSWIGVCSGLEPECHQSAAATSSWVHSDIVDPWARSSSASLRASTSP